MSWELVSTWVEGHPGLASWVQAFGSVIAILIAVWISSTESRARKVAEKNARKDAIVRCQWVLASSGDVVEKIIKSLTEDGLTEVVAIAHIARLDAVHNEIRELAYGPGMDSDVFSVILGARLGADRLRNKLQEWLNASDTLDCKFESLQSCFSAIDFAITKLDQMEADLDSGRSWLSGIIR